MPKIVSLPYDTMGYLRCAWQVYPPGYFRLVQVSEQPTISIGAKRSTYTRVPLK